ncbi:MAG TPA: plastocyanin/azurin family copper-binding protein [Solirubrobacteraceae bacterium]|nr:plastocyanin/azurin family copper-binding protein [Solirubrobacteraceae bacterium]
MKRALSILLAAGLLAGCGGGGEDEPSAGGAGGNGAAAESAPPAQGSGIQIAMQDIAFVPQETEVRVGQTVTWTNEDEVLHNVVATSGADFESELFGQGGTYSFKPTEPGTIEYVCTVHPGMTASLTVVE